MKNVIQTLHEELNQSLEEIDALRDEVKALTRARDDLQRMHGEDLKRFTADRNLLRGALSGLLEEAELEHPNWSLLERRCLDAEEALAATDMERLKISPQVP